MDWCDATKAPLNKQAIKHIYGVGLPPTDPRLTGDVNLQLMNYIKQAEDGIKATKEIMKLQVTTRPWQMNDSKKERVRTACYRNIRHDTSDSMCRTSIRGHTSWTS